jgi:hypothetical protein
VKRIVVLVLALSMLFAVQIGPVLSQDLPRHSHIMLLGLEFDDTGEPIGFRRCVDLAGGRDVPLHAHHDNLHVFQGGAASEALMGRANIWVIPSAGLAPWDDCAGFIEFMTAGG